MKNFNKKLIIHIGYPKTASTTLQLNLMGKLIKLKKILCLAHAPELPGYAYKNKLNIHNCYNYILSGKKNNDKINKELKNLQRINQKVSLLSSESLAWIAEDTKSDHSKLPLLINKNSERMYELFNEYFSKIIIVIVIRNQKELCPSIYKETLEVMRLPDYKNWIRKILVKKGVKNSFLNFNRQISNYQKLFGKKNVKVLLYEDLLYDQDYFFNQLSKIFNTTKNFTKKNFLKKKVNINPYSFVSNFTLSNFITIFLARYIQRIIPKIFYNFLQKIYSFTLKKLFDLIAFKKTSINLKNQKDKKFILSKFKKINKSLIVRGINKHKLKEYDYI